MTDRNRLSDGQLAELKARHPCDQVAERLGVRLRRRGHKMTGPCPVCSVDKQSRRATRFDCDAEGWVCANCHSGGDVIALVQKALACDFRAAVDWLGGARDVDPAEAARLAEAAKQKAALRDRQAASYREAERKSTYEIWRDGKPIEGSAAAAYLERRHLALPAGAKLRSLPALAYFERIGEPARQEVIHRGPAMLAPIVTAAGKFSGVHLTYIDLDQPKAKLAIRHPDDGEPLPAKKVRGSKGDGRIELVAAAAPRVLFLGEGIETVLSVWRAYVAGDRDLDGVAFWSSIDLGHLAGRAIESVPHPTARDKAGRRSRVPGPDPDPESTVIAIPDSVVELVILGDGDSDPFATAMAVYRTGRRFARPGRLVRAAWAPPGLDFNDLAPDWPAILAIVDAAAPPALPAIGAAEESKAAPRQRRVRSASSAGPAAAAAGSSGSAEPGAAADPAPSFSNSAASPTSPTEGEKSGEILAIDDNEIAEATIVEAAELDHSDTDNAKRLRLYYGRDLTVMAQSGTDKDAWLAWTGRFWDLDGGNAGASIIAQRVGKLIKAEADVLAATPREQRAIDAGAKARVELSRIEGAERSESTAARMAELQDQVDNGMLAMAAIGDRKKQRRKHAVSSKNASKIDAMLRLLAPHLRRPPDDFNRDPMLVATRSHTLRFKRTVDAAGKVSAEVVAVPVHDRADLITALIPIDYDPAATCPKFVANMARFQPEPERRRSVQQFSGLGLLGVALQKVMYHYGTGGNFKSVFLEVITRTLGDGFAIGLPAESISGREERSAGQASPDLARVFGKRMLRVLELPDGQPLQAGTIKKLTGGEKWPVRTLFKGYFEFQPRAKTHMSGNSLPHFDGSDGGMRRRLEMVEWPVTIAAAEQRDFEDVVSELMAEAPGILNWLIAGALDYLEHGLYVAPSIAALTQEQIEEMDPIGQFFKDCVEPDPAGPGVQARPMYAAYRSWSEANAKRVRSENKFGREMKKLCRRDDSGRVHIYADVRLHDVPASAVDEARDKGRRDIDGGGFDATDPVL